jgi:hypothetical protein
MHFETLCESKLSEGPEKESERRWDRGKGIPLFFKYTLHYLKGENDEVLEKNFYPGKYFSVQQYGFFSNSQERLCRVPQKGDARRRPAISRRQDVEGRC